MPNLSENHQQTIQLTSGLTYEQLPNGIHKFVVNDVTQETIDCFYEKSHAIDLAEYEAGSHARYLYVGNVFGLSPYFILKLIQLAQDTPDNMVESMAIVSNSFIAKIARNAIFRKTPLRTLQATAFFLTEEEAIEWLEHRHQELG